MGTEMTDPALTDTQRTAEPTVAELVKQLSEQSTRLARQEVELAKAELGQKARQAGIGIGMFGGAGTFAFYAFGALVTAAILGVATAVAAWVAALIVAAILALAAGGFALQGKQRVERATPPVPEQATGSFRDDVHAVRSHARAGRK